MQPLRQVMPWPLLSILASSTIAATLIPTIDLQSSHAQTRPTIQSKRRKPNPKPTVTPRPTPSPSQSPAQSGLSPLAQEMVSSHNQVRAQVKLAPVTWSPSLAAYAQEWANKLAATGQFEHRQNSRYGENLYWIQGRAARPSDVVGSWASEVKDYNYANNSCRGVCGHYTQLVWRNTTEIGCAVAKVSNQEYWVCNYNPPGNYVGQKPY